MSKLIFIQPTSHSSEQQHTKVWAFFVELQIMTTCESAPGLGKVGCLPFLANPWEYFYLFRLHCPPAQILSGSHSWVENGARWQESMHKKCKEQVLLNVKLKRTICPVPEVTPGSDGTCALRHFCYKPKPCLSSPGDWCHARGGCASAVGRALPLDHTAAILQKNSCASQWHYLDSTKKGSSIVCAEVVNLPR